ncbi:hypothetical protein BX600DRAFT_437990 [Xylariales sp. PMI_506]|nr:hypothetical protein BX600DRAFT_437990 [Xylariales sp. PMI_506]
MGKLFQKREPAASYPLDTTIHMQPSKAYYMEQKGNTSLVTEATSILADWTSLEDPGILDRVSAATTGKPTTFELSHSETSRSAQPVIETASKAAVAELKGGVLSLGHWTISFPAGSAHSSHEIAMRPAGIASRADEFVHNSVPFFWEQTRRHQLMQLFKAADGKRVEVARFIGKKPSAKDGVLLLDEDQIDRLIAVITCVAELHRVESFRA